MVNRNVCFQFCQQTSGVQKTCLRFQQNCVCVFRFHAEYLDPIVKADQCAEYLDDIGITTLQPTLLKMSRGTFGQSSGTFTKQGWNWQKRNAFSESDMLNTLAEASHRKQARKNQKRSQQTQIPQIEKGTTALLGVYELLQKLYP